MRSNSHSDLVRIPPYGTYLRNSKQTSTNKSSKLAPELVMKIRILLHSNWSKNRSFWST